MPYLVLKVIWLTGGQLGVADAAMMRDSSLVALNVATAGMDLVGIAMALAFTHAWGQRIPAWLLLPPIWVAMGLLVRFVTLVPLTMAAGVLTLRSTPPGAAAATAAAGGPVQPWVYTLVYTEFVGLGVGLTIAFVLYARVRWPWAFQSTSKVTAGPPGVSLPGATHGVQVPLATAAALMAAAAGALRIAWAFGVTIGLPEAIVARRTLLSHLLNGIDGATMIAAAIGVLVLVYRAGTRRSFVLPLTLAWIGSGSLFAWGLWSLINALANTALVRGRAIGAPPILGLLDLVQLMAGLVIGVVLLFLLAERQAASQTGDQTGT